MYPVYPTRAHLAAGDLPFSGDELGIVLLVKALNVASGRTHRPGG
jgi:hypothetical protein